MDNLDDKNLELLKAFLNEQPNILWIDDHSNLSPFFVNNRAKAFYGISSNNLSNKGFNFYKNLLHPVAFDNLKNIVFSFSAEKDFIHHETSHVKVSDGSYKYVYLASKALNYDSKGKPHLILSVIYDIDDLIGLLNQPKSKNSNISFELANKHLYQSLSAREKEILHLIADGFKNSEISTQLNIKIDTVKSHRKAILRKLQVNNSFELVKFAIFFS